jgi:hypothetical protein
MHIDMHIEIAERLHPFSHVPGIVSVLPGSRLSVQVFPALLVLKDLSASRPRDGGEVRFSIKGPVRDFTVVQDLERRELVVFGHAQDGYFRYKCAALSEERMALQIIKGNVSVLSHSDAVDLTPVSHFQKDVERLSLGNHKSQDWTAIESRQRLEEILPLWFALGQLTPQLTSGAYLGTAQLLEEFRALIARKERTELASAFHKIWLAGFSGMLVPRLEDCQHQGFALPSVPENAQLSPLVLLTEGAGLIRSLFVEQQENEFHFLPALPPEFNSGRMLGIQCPPFGNFDLEWSKKTVRRIVLRAASDGELKLKFQPDLKEYRLRGGESIKCGSAISIEKGKQYLLDNFRR